MWGELLTAGIGLATSLFGKKKQKVSNEVDYGKMVESATAAGFNPLTALRNGGSAGFTTTTSPTISAMPEVLGQLGGVLGNALDEKLDPIAAKKREIDTILVDRQLSQLKEGRQFPGRMVQPSFFEGTKVSNQFVPRVRASRNAVSNTANLVPPYKPQNPNLVAGKPPEASDIGMNNGRYGWFDPGWVPDAGGAISDAYGEPGEWVGGVAKFGTGVVYSGYRNFKSAFADAKSAYAREQTRSKPSTPYRPRLPGGWVGGSLLRNERKTRPIAGGGGGW